MAERPTGTPCWVDISVPDVDAAKTFYTGLLGWDCRTDPRPEAGGYTMCFVDGVTAAAITPMWGEDAKAGWSVYFASDDVDVSAAAVADNGGQVLAPPMDVFDAGRMAFALDPVGATFGIWQKGVHRGMETDFGPGAVAWIELVARGTETAAAFYGAVFGLEAAPFPDMPTYWLLQQGGVTAGGLIELDEARSGAEGSHWRVYVGVADADASCDRAVELGGSVEVAPFAAAGIGRIAFLRDPFNVRLGIIAPEQPAS
jgi:predicted enzyme related to lactoylglutathione lyase